MISRWVLPLAAAFVLAASGSALAEKGVEVPLPEVEAKFDASFMPQQLSRSKQTPLSPWALMRFKPVEFSHVPALEEFEIEEDRHLRLNLEGVPVCHRGTTDSPPLRQTCKEALIGRGRMVTEFRFPESEAISDRSEVTLYNAGIHSGVRTLFAVTYLIIPIPQEIVSTVTVKKVSDSRYGLRLIGAIPRLGGGVGSITRLALRFHESIFTATCPADRRLDTRFNTTFVDGTDLGGDVVRPCTSAP